MNSPLRIAIIGSGPAGCFTAEELLQCGRPVAITLFERLPRPGGLVHYGVAPDHPHTRRLVRLMERTFAAVTLRTWVEVGRDLSVEQLRREFDAVVVATGAEEERRLDIPGEQLARVHSARAFAGWLNGHPDYAQEPFAFRGETAVVIGHGNVALDVVRMLCHAPERLRETDAAPAAVAALSASAIRTIHLVGRGGPARAAFGESELAELGELPGVALRVDPASLDVAEVCDSDRSRAVVKLLRDFAERPDPREIHRTVSIEFLCRPLSIQGTNRADSITLARLTGIPQTIPCGLILTAIGQRTRRLPGLPYDTQQSLIPSESHRIERGLYATGWSARPAQGLIGHNRRDASATVAAILEDFGVEPPVGFEPTTC